MNNYVQYIKLHLLKRVYLRAICNPHLLTDKQKSFLRNENRDLIEGLNHYDKLRDDIKKEEWLSMLDETFLSELAEDELLIAWVLAEFFNEKLLQNKRSKN